MPRIILDIGDIMDGFPSYRVAMVVAENLSIPAERSAEAAYFLDKTEGELRAKLEGADIAEILEIKAWRAAYRAFGVKKTSYRSSVERLLKTIQKTGALPRVNLLVDLYNTVSASFRMPVGADDLDRLAPPLAYRHSRPGDSFVALGDEGRTPNPPKDGEIVYADSEKVLCRRWNWYQDARSAIGPGTRRAVLNIEALEPTPDWRLEDAAAGLSGLLAAHCGAACRWGIASKDAPRVEV